MVGQREAHFRADVEGLRALAAMAILVFHVSPDILPGGFIGVDLFFVISGYLITASICRDVAAERFSLIDFYARRIRRLYPALLVVILATMAAAYFFLFARELRAASRGAIATIFYVSNFYFSAHADYFDEGKIRPLLHTWSLAVEEQFYLIYPVFLFGLLKARGGARTARIIRALLAVTGVSLLLAEIAMRFDPSVTFFMSPTRFWEFAIGGLMAVLAPLAWPRWAREAGAIAGLAAVVAAMILFSDATPVPGAAALLPVLGMALLIKLGEAPTLVARIFSVSPARFIGRISYSLYLVHWPLIVVLTANEYDMSLRRERLFAFAASILLAWLLYVLVEEPTRRIRIARRRLQVFAFGGAGTVVVASLAVAILAAGGFRSRFPMRSREMIAYLDYDPRPVYRSGRCLMNAKSERNGATFDAAACIGATAAHGKSRVLLIGDSHAAQYYEAAKKVFPGIQLAQVTATGCRPLLHAAGSERCVQLMKTTFEGLIGKGVFDSVILTGRWRDQDLADLDPTAEFVSRHASRVYIIGPVVEYGMPLPRLLALSYLDNKLDEPDGDQSVDDERHWRRAALMDERMTHLLGSMPSNVHYLSALSAMCQDSEDCTTLTPSGSPTQFDYGHLTYEGAVEVIRKLKSRGLMADQTANRPKRSPGPGAARSPSATGAADIRGAVRSA